MKYSATERQQNDGHWVLRHESDEIGALEVSAATREEAREKLRGEIRYHLELCPCTGESYRHIDIELRPLSQ